MFVNFLVAFVEALEKNQVAYVARGAKQLHEPSRSHFPSQERDFLPARARRESRTAGTMTRTSKGLEKGRPLKLLHGQAAPHSLTHGGAGSVPLRIIQHIAHDTWLVHGYMMSAGWHY